MTLNRNFIYIKIEEYIVKKNKTKKIQKQKK